MNITPSTYKDVPALACEANGLRARFLPEHGGKCASLVDLATGRELLEQAPGEQYLPLTYGGDYVAAECSAFDDMFPTIDACHYPDFPWQGALMPDHGEVCGLPWQHERTGAGLHLWVYSLRFGYRLDKWVEPGEGGLVIRYEARNLTPYPLDCLYAAHLMLAAERGAEIELPYAEGAACTVVFTDDPLMGGYGDKLPWREALAPTPGRDARLAYKLFFDAPPPAGWCRYRYADGTAFELTFDRQQLPYLALWANYGRFKGLYNVAFEPMTAAFDRPDIARLHRKNCVLPGNGVLRWQLGLRMVR